jgi:hypothetical protein
MASGESRVTLTEIYIYIRAQVRKKNSVLIFGGCAFFTPAPGGVDSPLAKADLSMLTKVQTRH